MLILVSHRVDAHSLGLGEDAVPEMLSARLAGAELRQPLVLRQMTWRGERVWRIGWAVLRPAP